MTSLQHGLIGASGELTTGRAVVSRAGATTYRAQTVIGVILGLAYIAAVGASIDAVAIAVVVAVAGLSLLVPVLGLTVLALIIPMSEPDLFRPLYVDAVILGATALGCLLLSTRDRRPHRIHPGVVVLLGYALYTGASVALIIVDRPPDWLPTAGLQALHVLSGIGLFLVASYVFRWVSPLPVVAVALLGGLLAATLALAGFFEVGPRSLLDGLLPSPTVDRASGSFGNANFLGLYLAQVGLLAIGLLAVARARYRPALILLILLFIAALLLTYSRSAYIGFMAGLIVLAFLRSPRAGFALMLVSAVAIVFLYPAFLNARLGSDVLDASTITQRALSEQGRRLAAAAGVSLFLTAPVFGVGFGVFHELSPAFVGASQATYSHNMYIQILAEQGIIGALLSATIVVLLIVAVLRSVNPLRRPALAMLGAYLIQSFFINSMVSLQASGLTWLVMAAALSAWPRRSGPRTQEV